MIREARMDDMDGLLALYAHLHDNPIPEKDQDVTHIWNTILDNEDHHIVVAEENGVLVSTCTLIVIRNLTHSQRPYAILENVVTDERYRMQGFSRACIDHAKDIAVKEDCYKIMLMTGSDERWVLGFYESCGYNRNDKTGFIQWLDP